MFKLRLAALFEPVEVGYNKVREKGNASMNMCKYDVALMDSGALL